ncbi:LytR C-terminal domain-containing protein [Mitsuaria sp. BK037]|uniref:LytR C-terminal domain-containing protein n=1 Tax=Mitsuaria sp. BK037 TaxID=2587122 RepID=UPI00160E359C|nr:LytR C-terminal domain-containing protein [Mitsuaria sp. BK037]MBB3281984.1 Tfp pilus assembly protein PilF [Mitsuaria sp. BK037]
MRVQSRFPSPASALPAPASERPRAAPSRSGAPVVDVELDLDPAICLGAAPAALPPRTRPGRGRAAGLRRAVALGQAASALTLAGCALWPPAAPPRAYQVAPVYRVDDTPQAVQAYLAAGRYFEGSRDWPRAAQSYRKATERDASSEAAWDGLGRTLASAGRLDEAEAALRQAVALAPKRARAHNNLAYVLLLKDQPAPALAALDEALALDPTHAMARANRDEAMTRLAATRPETATTASASASATTATAPTTTTTTTAIVMPPPALDTAPIPALDTAPIPATRLPTTELATIAAAASLGQALSPPDGCAPPKRLEVSNGMGATGMAARVEGWLSQRGLPRARLTNQPAYDVVRTRVDYAAGQAAAARCVALALPAGVTTALSERAGLRGDVRLVLGRDWPARLAEGTETHAGL